MKCEKEEKKKNANHIHLNRVQILILSKKVEWEN